MHVDDTRRDRNSEHDSDRFKLLFDTHYRKLVIFANSFVLNLAAAEDIIQTVFVEIWQNGAWKSESISIKSYLYTAVKNRCLNEIRNVNVKDAHNLQYVQAMLDVWEDGEREDDDLMTELRKCIELLPAQVRRIIELRYFEGKSVSETASILRVSPNTIKTQIKRGRANLKERLGHQH